VVCCCWLAGEAFFGTEILFLLHLCCAYLLCFALLVVCLFVHDFCELYLAIAIAIHDQDLTSAWWCSAGKVDATARCIHPPARCTCHSSSHARIEAPTPGYTLFDFVAACGRSTGVPLFVACSRSWATLQSLHHDAERGGLKAEFKYRSECYAVVGVLGRVEGKDEMHVILYE
jgi:hypothetical protein